MCVQVVAHQHYYVCVRIVFVHQFLDFLCPFVLASFLPYGHTSPSSKWLVEHECAACAISHILMVYFLDMVFFGKRYGLPRVFVQFYRLLVHVSWGRGI